MEWQNKNKVSWKQGMLNLEYPEPQLCPPEVEIGAIPKETLGREQQMFKAWKEQLDEETQLLEKIASVGILKKAYRRVKRNKGAAGVDGMTVDDLDKELEKRGHKFCRYADDCMIFVRTMKAGHRVLASVTRFIESKLKLKVNREKSQVDYVACRTYLGYRISPKRLLVAPKSAESLKNKVRLIARRGRPTPLRQVIDELNPLIRGWAEYYKHAAFKKKSGELDAWIRRKLRCMRLKQCKHPKGIKRLLSPPVIYKVTGMGRRWWRISKAWPSHGAMNNEWFREQGLVSLQAWFQPRV